MLKMSDVSIERFLPVFASAGVQVAFLVPTPTGYGKSIMDATAPVRALLLDEHVHNYAAQAQGLQNKILVDAHFVEENKLIHSKASLYRPVTKKGDPRIWFTDLKKYCDPCNLLALIILRGEIYVFNLSSESVVNSLTDHGLAYEILDEAARQDNQIALELLQKIREIHNRGFLPSITEGDPGVGDTLENALGISRNNSKAPDYKGIELKSTRLTRAGVPRHTTRTTLFTRVPDKGMTYKEIVDNFGKIQTPRGATVPRLQLYETLRTSRANAYGLLLKIEAEEDKLNILHENHGSRSFVSAWIMQNLRDALLTKHRETFWVKATAEMHEGREYFRYDKILHTKKPNVSLLSPLIEADKITVDLAAHYKPDGKWKDHGVLFKLSPQDLPLLFGTPTEYVL